MPPRTPSAGMPLDARLRSLAQLLAARGVDSLEQRALRVVEREEVDEPDVLEHLGRAVPCERDPLPSIDEERRHGVGAHSAQRVLRRGSHPPALVGQSGVRRVGAASAPSTWPAARAAWTRTNHSLSSSRASSADADVVAAPRPERLDGSGADVRVAVPGELDERRLTEIRIRAAATSRPRSEPPGSSRAATGGASRPEPGRAARARMRSRER